MVLSVTMPKGQWFDWHNEPGGLWLPRTLTNIAALYAAAVAEARHRVQALQGRKNRRIE